MGLPCLERGCSKCCWETEMLLTEEDIARLEAKGHARERFVEIDGEGFASLRNVPAAAPDEGHHCVFLTKTGGAPEGADPDHKPGWTCGVYADRPQGCRHYPLALTPEGRMVRDDECPHRAAFSIPPDGQRRLRALYNVVLKEAGRRAK
ncbi:MAG TPA: YkgJ family cysteine cluster protein [Candidatus Thermoplasmatota archaeon]|nr:YkgJ family cysteine cluster protein [Candidatus Thermoplasmatota archaeon]